MKENLVVFVHGLFGSQHTWSNKDANGFMDLLFTDKGISNSCDKHNFEYYTSISNIKYRLTWLFDFINNNNRYKNNIPIDRIAKTLTSRLRNLSDSYDNIFIIAHSMGGLIVRRMLVDSASEDFYRKIKIYFSLAVPNNGAELAILGKFLKPSHKNLRELCSDGKFIFDLNKNWIQNSSILPDTIYFVGEMDEIVSVYSAEMLEIRKNFEVFNTADNHFSIVKPKNTNADQIFRVINRINKHNAEILENKLVISLVAKYNQMPLFRKLYSNDGKVSENNLQRLSHTSEFKYLIRKLQEDKLLEDSNQVNLNELGQKVYSFL